jgi:hypothetical protein
MRAFLLPPNVDATSHTPHLPHNITQVVVSKATQPRSLQRVSNWVRSSGIIVFVDAMARSRPKRQLFLLFIGRLFKLLYQYNLALHLLSFRPYLPVTSFPQSQSGGPSVGQEPDLNPPAHLGLEDVLGDQRLRITPAKRQSGHVSDAPLESKDKAKVVDDPVCPGILLAGPGSSLFASWTFLPPPSLAIFKTLFWLRMIWR